MIPSRLASFRSLKATCRYWRALAPKPDTGVWGVPVTVAVGEVKCCLTASDRSFLPSKEDEVVVISFVALGASPKPLV